MTPSSIRPFSLLFLLLVACSSDDGNTSNATSAQDQGNTATQLDMSTTSEVDLSSPKEDMATLLDMSSPKEDMSSFGLDMFVATDMSMEEDLSSSMDMSVQADMSTTSFPLPGFGTLQGDCNEIDMMELTPGQNFYFENTLDFAQDPYDEADKPLLSPGGRRVVDTPNAGGQSILSEAFAYEVLYRCESATLLKTENEIEYDPKTKITDLLVEIDGQKVGVSVVRAIAFPFEDPYPDSEAVRILTGKLQDIQVSSSNVTPQDKWVKQILSVIAYKPEHAVTLKKAYDALDPAIKGDTIVIVTVTEGNDKPIYNIKD